MRDVYTDDCELPEFYNEERVTARRVHVCGECNRAIPNGTTYVRCTGKIDGSFFSEKQHVECRDFAAKVNVGFLAACVIPFGRIDQALKVPEDFGIEFDDENAQADLAKWDAFRAEWSRIKVLYPEREAA